MPTKSYQENENLRNIGVVLANRTGSNGRVASSQGTVSPCLGLNPAANRSMESLRILQWCQEFDLSRPATNEGLEMYKEASRFLPNKDAQVEIPKFSALQVRMQELQRAYGLLQDKQDFTEEESERRRELKAEWARLKPEYDNLLQRLRGKREQYDLCKAYRRTSRERKAKFEAAEFASLETQTGILDPTSAGTALQKTTNELGQQRLGTPGNSPWSPNSQVDRNTDSLQDPEHNI